MNRQFGVQNPACSLPLEDKSMFSSTFKKRRDAALDLAYGLTEHF